MINESLSFDSTLESPTKPHQEKNSNQNKAIFLVHCMNDNQTNNQINGKLNKNEQGNSPDNKFKKKSKRGPKPKKFEKIKKGENNMLDFDSLLDTLFPKPKIEIVSSLKKKDLSLKKYQKKLLGYKRKRTIRDCLRSKKIKLIKFIYRI